MDRLETSRPDQKMALCWCLRQAPVSGGLIPPDCPALMASGQRAGGDALTKEMPPLTPYGIMKLGRVKCLPFFLPCDPAMGEAARGLGGERSEDTGAEYKPAGDTDGSLGWMEIWV